ncbi:MAG TPA: hypothetical protein VJI13_01760 [Candidatus Norongarragalinales archaeon]|nr:hypothetical protein [Candidatus Norongarragalinales archaeon]
MGAILAGPVSRSDKTAAAHRAVRDGQAGIAEFEKAIESDRIQIVSSQKNFAFVSGGQSDWLDIMRPLAHGLPGFEKRQTSGEDSIGPVTRWFSTNTFYRKPTIIGQIRSLGNEISGALPEIQNGIAFLLGPYSFCRLVENSHYKNNAELMGDYSKAIVANLAQLGRKGYKCILFLEPCIGYEQPSKKLETPAGYLEALDIVSGKGLKLGIHFPQANGALAIPIVEDARIDFVGIDGIHTDFSKVSTRKDLLLGIVDGGRAGIEGADSLKNEIARFQSEAQFSGRYYIGPNDRLFDVPFGIALEKIRALSALGEQPL